MKHINILCANENSLHNVSVKIPKNQMVVVTGPSGSGKTSLVYDTIYQEGQRKYLMTMSIDARQFIGQIDKPDVQKIEGLCPTAAVSQRPEKRNIRATVGQSTDIYDLLMLLYARCGTVHCPSCHAVVEGVTCDEIVNYILNLPLNSKVMVLGCMKKEQMEADKEKELKSKGINYIYIKQKIGKVESISQIEDKEDIGFVIDRFIRREEIELRATNAVKKAMQEGGRVSVVVIEEEQENQVFFAVENVCPECGRRIEEKKPSHFNFNSPYGACPECGGMGTILEIDEDKVVPDPALSFHEGAIVSINPKSPWYRSIFEGLAEHFHFSLDTPWNQLESKFVDIMLYGTEEEFNVSYTTKEKQGKFEYSSGYSGAIPDLMKRYKNSKSQETKMFIETFMHTETCEKCNGERLNENGLSVTVNGKKIIELLRMSVEGLRYFLEESKDSKINTEAAQLIIKQLANKLTVMKRTGIGYLTIDRTIDSLSWGEYQRMRLSSLLGNGMEDILIILDEPTVGLHPRDVKNLIGIMKELTEQGNTVLVVEHDEQVIRNADYIIDMGPSAGIMGGRIMESGVLSDILQSQKSITGKYLRQMQSEQLDGKRRDYTKRSCISLEGIQKRNLKNVSVQIPLGCFVALTGVSGSGKSTLMGEVIYPAIKQCCQKRTSYQKYCRSISGTSEITGITYINQKPIGQSPRSNPATFIGVMEEIRDLFAALPDAKVKGLKKKHFSFNTKGGSCENCGGGGKVKVEMMFMPDVYVKCNVCKGKRYNQEVLSVLFENKSIYDILEMSVTEALAFFSKVPKIRKKLELLQDIGLGYLKLGQPANTLSGGESQRLKLANELYQTADGPILYMLDEPTTGLHFSDVSILMILLQKLVDMGNTVMVIEHDMEVVRQADYVIDIGPDGGNNGGNVVFQGSPDALTAVEESYTGQFLKAHMEK